MAIREGIKQVKPKEVWTFYDSDTGTETRAGQRAAGHRRAATLCVTCAMMRKFLRQLFCRHTALRVWRCHPKVVRPEMRGKLLYVDRYGVHNFIFP